MRAAYSLFRRIARHISNTLAAGIKCHTGMELLPGTNPKQTAKDAKSAKIKKSVHLAECNTLRSSRFILCVLRGEIP